MLAGCGEELAPLRFQTGDVTGRVTYRGEPVATGWIEFEPVGGTVGNVRTARLGADGRFAASGVAVGRNQVKISRANPPLPDKYSTGDTVLFIDVRARTETVFTLDLKE